MLFFGVGAFVGSGGQVGQHALRLLATIGAPQYEAYRDLYGDDGGSQSADYILFYKGELGPVAEAYFAARDDVTISGKSALQQSIIVTINEPSRDRADELRAQEFVWMLVRDRPFFFCH